jgi:putative endonuclease
LRRTERRAADARRIATTGEELAVAHLTSHGFEILDRNWRAGHAELDIVAIEGDVVAFVEVKTRRGGPQDPLEAISREKRRLMRRAAATWISRHPGVGREFRFDAIGVRLPPGGEPAVNHVRQAFYGEDDWDACS